MPAFHVARSIVIQRPPEEVFDTVVDYNTWTSWSPWLGIDKEASVTVNGDGTSLGSTYSWDGELVGAGEMEHAEQSRPSFIEDQLRFTKPFKSESGVRFDLQPVDGGTELTWHMDGSLPWFMFWMLSSMETFIGMDYERGLRMIRDRLEKGSVPSEVVVLGIESTPPMHVCGVHDNCPMKDVGPAMGKAFSAVESAFEKHGLSTDGEMISVYHPMPLKKGRFDFTSGYTVDDAAAASRSGLAHCELPAAQSLHIRHVGSYDHLGNAWSGAHQYARYKKLKLAKGDAFEIYRNDPSQTAEADLITDVYIPLK